MAITLNLASQLSLMDLPGFSFFIHFHFLRDIIILYPKKSNLLIHYVYRLASHKCSCLRLLNNEITGLSYCDWLFLIFIRKYWTSSWTFSFSIYIRFKSIFTGSMMGWAMPKLSFSFSSFRHQYSNNYHIISLGNLTSQVQVHPQMNFWASFIFLPDSCSP